MKKISVLYVCMGNICRSPALAAILQQLVEKKGVADRFHIDSSGIASYYIGKQADHRIRSAAEKKGVVIDHLAQLVDPIHFQQFDYIFAVNEEVKHLLLTLATEEEKKKIFLATHFGKQHRNEEIPDPFHRGPNAFDDVIEIAFDACQGFLDFAL
jgi:protein-tyrosine phosphatase